MRHKLFVPWGTRLGAVLTALCLFGCGSADNGNGSDSWDGYCSGGPVFGGSAKYLVENESGIQALTLEGGWAYWIASEVDANGPSATVMRQCDISDCENTLHSDTLPTTTGNMWLFADFIVSLVASNERLFWPTEWGVLPGISRCKKSSCHKPDTINLGGATVSYFILDGNQLVIATTEATLLTCDEADCEGSLARVPVVAPTGEIAFAGASNLAVDAEYYYFLSEQRILRLVKDGSMPFEVIARVVGKVKQLAVQGDSVYWLESFPPKLRSCPKTGCTSNPTTLAAELHDPFAVIVEDNATYVSEPAESAVAAVLDQMLSPGSNRILRCSETNCADLPFPAGDHGYEVAGSIAVDATNIYGIGRISSQGPYAEYCSAIYVTPKSTGAAQ